jgi:hypothetical protein
MLDGAPLVTVVGLTLVARSVSRLVLSGLRLMLGPLLMLTIGLATHARSVFVGASHAPIGLTSCPVGLNLMLQSVSPHALCGLASRLLILTLMPCFGLTSLLDWSHLAIFRRGRLVSSLANGLTSYSIDLATRNRSVPPHVRSGLASLNNRSHYPLIAPVGLDRMPGVRPRNRSVSASIAQSWPHLVAVDYTPPLTDWVSRGGRSPPHALSVSLSRDPVSLALRSFVGRALRRSRPRGGLAASRRWRSVCPRSGEYHPRNQSGLASCSVRCRRH